MKSFLQLVVIAVIGIGSLLFVGLFTMSTVATSHDVVRVPVPRASYLSGAAPAAYYADAYVAPMRYSSYVSIEEVEAEVFHKGSKEVYRSGAELAYAGKAPGVSYQIAYLLDVGARPRTLTVSTTVIVHNWVGKVYWTLTRPVHRMIVPVMLDRMAQAAPKR